MFRFAIQKFIEKHKIKSVGGMYPVLKVTGRRVEHIGQQIEVPIGGTCIDLSHRTGRWVQRNLTTRKEIPLLMPWEFLKETPSEEKTFEDLSEALGPFFRDMK
jgi:hypothetical protein